jgi:hypothetical protein
MSVDIRDDLEAAEDYIGELQQHITQIRAAWDRAVPSIKAPSLSYRTYVIACVEEAIANAEVSQRAGYCWPTCGVCCDDDNPCGCSCHNAHSVPQLSEHQDAPEVEP